MKNSWTIGRTKDSAGVGASRFVGARASRDKAFDAVSFVIGEAKLTLTYANRETLTIQRGWQFNVGIHALLDEALRRL